MRLSTNETETYLDALERGLSDAEALALAVGAGPVKVSRPGETPRTLGPYTHSQAGAIILKGLQRGGSLYRELAEEEEEYADA